jgi:xylulokinase
MKRYVLAHDLGTSGNKATLFDEHGALVESRVTPYSMEVFNSNWAEQDPSIWWNAVCSSSREVLSTINPKDVAVVSFSGQMMGCLPVDKEGKPLHNALLYCDQRSTSEEQEFIQVLGFDQIYQITGHRPSASYSLTKLLWIKKHRPEVYEKTYKVLQAKDYMNFLLTGEYATDYNDASGTNAFDLASLNWSDVILDAMGVPSSLFPKAFPSSTKIGEVHRRASEETGIPEGTAVIVGAGDGGCASLGAGSVSFGKPYIYMGSSSWVSIASKKPLDDPEKVGFTWAHPVAGLYQPCATMQTAGGSLSWFAKTYLGNDKGKTLDTVNNLAQGSSPGANGLVFLPYLLGERSPWWNTKAKGAFVGMDVSTTFQDHCRALLEGVAMNQKLNFAAMLNEIPDRRVMFIGGGGLNTFLRQVLADVFGCEIVVPQFLTEATSMGAALLGGVGSGLYEDFSMIESMNPIKEIVQPNKENIAFYEELTGRFADLYRSLEPWFNR